MKRGEEKTYVHAHQVYSENDCENDFASKEPKIKLI